jgi:hypothetical protein
MDDGGFELEPELPAAYVFSARAHAQALHYLQDVSELAREGIDE